jgi:hypothetical protein
VPQPATPPARSARAWLLEPRSAERDGRLTISYAGGIALLWSALAAVGIGFGILSVASGANPESRYIAFGLGAVCTFVAWFAVRPVIVADRSGLAVLPVFGTKVSFRWDEVRGIGVRNSRRARGRGASLEIQAAEDREVKVDGMAVGATSKALSLMERRLRAFAGSIEVRNTIAVLVDDEAGMWDEAEK